MKKHHWIGRRPDPHLYFGFVYQITNLVDGRLYIGRKQYHKYRKGKKVGEMDWHNYTGSSKRLNDDIKKHGKDKFEFKILRQYKTRGGLVYGEANLLHKRNALTARLEGSDKRLYYNGRIDAIKFVPKEY